MFDGEATIPIRPYHCLFSTGLVQTIMSPKFSDVKLAFSFWGSLCEKSEDLFMDTIRMLQVKLRDKVSKFPYLEEVSP